MTDLTPPRFTEDEKRQAVLQALEQRKRIYPHLVAQGLMTAAEARAGIAVLRAVVADYIGPEGRIYGRARDD